MVAARRPASLKSSGTLNRDIGRLKKDTVFQGSLLFRQFRLSVVPLTAEQYDWLIAR